MNRRKKGEDTEQLPLFAETEPDWIHADVDAELRSTGSSGGNAAAYPSGKHEGLEIGEDGQDEELQQFALWLKRKGEGG